MCDGREHRGHGLVGEEPLDAVWVGGEGLEGRHHASIVQSSMDSRVRQQLLDDGVVHWQEVCWFIVIQINHLIRTRTRHKITHQGDKVRKGSG